jgi:hypothetical protein
MNRLLFFAALILFSLLISCSGAGEVEETFTTILNLHVSDDRSGIEDYFDEDTHYFIEQLVKNGRNREAEKANYLGQQNEVPISTMILYYTLAGTDERPDSSSLFSEDFLWAYFPLDGTGVFRHTNELPIRIHDNPVVYGDVANLSVSVPTGNNARLGTKYRFNREGDRWKLNLASTMELMEKIHKQNQRSSGLGVQEYAMRASQQVGKELGFQYRQYQ